MSKESNVIRILNKIYNSLPEFTCKEGCSWCCGNVPMAPIEVLNVAKFLKSNRIRITIPRIFKIPCPFITGDRCSIYEVRPIYCRLYGNVDDTALKCPHGCKPTQLLTEDEADVIMARVYTIEIE